MPADDFSGIWRCTYWYRSDRRGPGEYESTHHMMAQRRGNRVVFESLPGGDHSFLLIQLRIDDRVASGSWEETASEKGPFKGARYYGPVQLVLDEGRKAFRGMYITVGREMYVKTNKIELVHVPQSPAHVEVA